MTEFEYTTTFSEILQVCMGYQERKIVLSLNDVKSNLQVNNYAQTFRNNMPVPPGTQYQMYQVCRNYKVDVTENSKSNALF